MSNGPKPESKKYSDLINDIEKGIIKIPKFQRDFVWSMEKTAQLLDSILRGYPIGTFILWQTGESLNNIKNIGDISLPDTPADSKVQYVLDGQQRITSLFSAYRGAEILKDGKKKVSNYKDIVVRLDGGADNTDEQIVILKNEATNDNYIPLHDILQGDLIKLKNAFEDKYFTKVLEYREIFITYDFSVIVLRKEDTESAIEVFTRINTGGQTLTLFEIMSAKTYDEEQKFDMQEKKKDLDLALDEYSGVSGIVILHTLSLVLSSPRECKRSIILGLDKQEIIDVWDNVISALKDSIQYFKTEYRIPVSGLLPYESLLVPFSYFFFQNENDYPSVEQKGYLREFFWRTSLSGRYSSSTESALAQDIKRIDKILAGQRPDYDDDVQIYLNPESLIERKFRAGNSYCKAILCLLAYQRPKDFRHNREVTLDNSYLKVASSRNYHHFFPKKCFGQKGFENSNSVVNITLISDVENKRIIRHRKPSDYIGEFKKENPKINETLNTHFIEIEGFGIENDDYDAFLKARSMRICEQLKKNLDPNLD